MLAEDTRELEQHIVGHLLVNSDSADKLAYNAGLASNHFSDPTMAAVAMAIIRATPEQRANILGHLRQTEPAATALLEANGGLVKLISKDIPYALTSSSVYELQEARIRERATALIAALRSEIKRDTRKALESAVVEISNLLLERTREVDYQVGQAMADTLRWLEQPPTAPLLYAGLSGLDYHFQRLQGSELLILGARPATGKTALALQVLIETAKAGTPALFFSGEMSCRQLAIRMIAGDSGITQDRLLNRSLSQSEYARLYSAAETFAKLPLHIREIGKSTLADILVASRRAIARQGVKVIAIDYLQRIKTDQPQQQRYREVAMIANDLKVLCQETGCIVLALAQLNRNIESRTTSRPFLSDLGESGSIEAEADLIMLMSREKGETSKTGVFIEKNRSGKTGEAWLNLNGPLAKFEQIDPFDEVSEVKPHTTIGQNDYSEADDPWF
jgi:replicative DNA helicase